MVQRDLRRSEKVQRGPGRSKEVLGGHRKFQGGSEKSREEMAKLVGAVDRLHGDFLAQMNGWRSSPPASVVALPAPRSGPAVSAGR